MLNNVKRTRRSFIWLVIVFGSMAFLLNGCFKNQVFPLEPVIFEPEVTIMGDSAQVTFGFTDGDGNIGLADSDTTAPYDTASKYHYNLFIEYFEKDDALGWQPGLNLSGDTIIFLYRLHPIIVKGNSRGIKGTMDVMMADFFNPFSDQSDTIKYRIQLVDLSLNESNLLETEPVIYPH